jgi:hypothetical protein
MNLSVKCHTELAKETLEYLKEMKKKVDLCALKASSMHNESGFFYEVSSAIDNAERAIDAFKRKMC